MKIVIQKVKKIRKNTKKNENKNKKKEITYLLSKISLILSMSAST